MSDTSKKTPGVDTKLVARALSGGSTDTITKGDEKILLESSESNNEREKLRLAVQDKMAEVKANVSALPPIPAKFETSKSYLALVKSRRRPYANGVTNPRKRFDAIGKVQDDSDAIKKYNRLLSSLARSLTQCDDYESLLTKVNEGDDEEIKREEESVGDDEVLGSDEDTDDCIVVEMPTSKRQKRGKKSSTKLPSPGTSVTSLESAQPGEEVSLILQKIKALQKKKEEDSKKAKETLKKMEKMEKKLQKKIKEEAAEVKALKKKKLEESLKKKKMEEALKKKKKMEEAALKKKKKEQDAEEAVLKKKNEGEVLAVIKKKKEEETAAAAAAAEPKKNEEQEETAKKIPFKEIIASKKNTVLKKAKEAEAKKVADGEDCVQECREAVEKNEDEQDTWQHGILDGSGSGKSQKGEGCGGANNGGCEQNPESSYHSRTSRCCVLDPTCSGHSCSQ